ncbi:ABC transporter ATP-binding protein [Piscinibacter gummiphilus]|uniref:ABC transporter ATP-binding protein n=1 Tax=Piscinibacter gummiphilus TaxID=946333 RepID=A0ABZ0D7M4_9BURK|nr:ABC transporter ATP-binding protein [Piscinibacter gummiphilus]WOB11355.1 ABC transporter ATP-binding protein [Piscinibacter gummiphilus]
MEGDLEASRVLFARRQRDLVELFTPHRYDKPARVSMADLVAWLLSQATSSFSGELESVVSSVEDPQVRRRVRDELASSIVGTKPVALAWTFRAAPAPGLLGQLRAAGIVWRSTWIFALYALQYVLFLSAWALIGSITLTGRLDPDLLWGALLLFACAGLCRTLSSRLGIDTVISLSTVMKRWLFRGALRIDVDSARRRGTGNLIGLVLESNYIESVALDGVLLGMLAVVEAATVLGILLWSPLGRLAGLCYVILFIAVAIAGRLHYRAWISWSNAKARLTGELVEGVVGHRTRLAQCPPAAWFKREEVLLEQYRAESERVDRAHFWLLALLGRASIAIGLLALLPSFIREAASIELAVMVGAVLLGHGALSRVATALTQINAARGAFDRVAPLLDAAAAHRADRQPPHPRVGVPASVPLLEVRALRYRYPRARADLLESVSLRIGEGHRLLVEAPSGEGKSTLIAILAGLREATAGELKSRGIDRRLLSVADWGQRVVAVPQFNSNHVFTGTVAFNCLMGRGWPATTEDVAEAERVLRALALGPLLDAMPSGMQQTLGETGWRLSHGERSRLFLARAILQEPDVLLVDESLGTLDPATFLICLRFINETSRAVVMVAHR